jgi:C1A family cysteine protease
VVVTFNFHFVDNGCAQDAAGWESATAAKLDYWAKTLSLPMGQLKRIIIDDAFSEEGKIYKFPEIDKIYGLAVSGTIELYNEKSLVRVILVDDNLREYLVYEVYPRIVENKHFTFSNLCEETCILESVKPSSFRLDLVDASIRIDDVSYVDSPKVVERNIKTLRKQIKKDQDAEKIKKIKANIKSKKEEWIAGETSLSRLTYEEKKKFFGGDRVPNLHGAEYYKGGIFEIKTKGGSPSSSTQNTSSLPESFDWRNRHDADNPDSPYFDGDPFGSGWMSSVTNQGCGDCWAHSIVGTTEALANIYFNQHLDIKYGLNLSIQDVVSCNNGGASCSGGFVGWALPFIVNTGVVDEDCFPYVGRDEPCHSKCNDPSEIIHITDYKEISTYGGQNNIKQNLIDSGPLIFGIADWGHYMVLVGYTEDTLDGETIWILKNSWGIDWGENGYFSTKLDLR